MGAFAMASDLRHIPLSYNNVDSQTSALRIIFTLFPEWETSEGEVKLTRFTDGITNTLLKAAKRRPGLSEKEIDHTAVLLRAYGKGTEILIDREREKASHLLLARHHLAPPLLSRFQNGMIYRFIQGRVCSPADLRQESVWRGVARRLGQWHSVLPIIPAEAAQTEDDSRNGDEPCLSLSPTRKPPSLHEINAITPDKTTPNTWTVMQRWIYALPVGSEAEKKRKAVLQCELERVVTELGDLAEFGSKELVLAHCDLLSGNVIILEPETPAANGAGTETNGVSTKTNGTTPTTNGHHPKSSTSAAVVDTVAFIDYEYATSSPAAFDLANHFAEWGGFDCDFSALPTRSVRRAFLQEYLASYRSHLSTPSPSLPPESVPPSSSVDIDTDILTHTPNGHQPCDYSSSSSPPSPPQKDQQLDELFTAVDRFRGIPGLYWGIWALIQATISQIDFDYAAYAEIRLGEYWDWRAEADGSREREGRERGVRERRWAAE